MGWVAIASATCAAAILVMHLVRRRAEASKILLFVGLGVLPITSALAANVQGFAATQSRAFCGSCHVMQPYAAEAEDPQSRSLGAIHARNEAFGKDNCYACHKDYGMYGYVLTKAGGMRHVYYYLKDFRNVDLATAQRTIHIVKPVPNATCMHCHTTTAPGWQKIPDHASSLESVRGNTLGCASPGCHGKAHPKPLP